MITSLVMGNGAIADGPARKSDNVRTCRNLTVGSSQPDTMISGKLVHRMVWGPPNFGENPKTDAHYYDWFVILDYPIRVITGPDIGDLPGPVIVRKIEIRPVTRGEDEYFRFRNKHVVVRGKFATQASPFESTLVVMEASALGSGAAIHCPL